MAHTAGKGRQATRESVLKLVYAATCVLLVVSNLSAVKVYSLLGISVGGGLTTIVFDYVLGDLTTEVYGLGEALKVRRTALLLNVFAALMFQISVWTPADPEFTMQTEYAAIFTLAPRIVVASMAAYFAGTAINAKVMDAMHERDGEGNLFARCFMSSVFGEAADTVLFVVIAYFPEYTLVSLAQNAAIGFLLKLVVEAATYALCTRFVIAAVKELPF